ncbi:MAG: 30S ribosomal protein S20 [Phycisphaerae bacterium]|nr:30S ribosomal protein S20 [Phycisphaerae bacterium]
MAHSLSAEKRVRQNAKHRAVNRWRLKIMRDAVRDFQEQVLHGTAETANEAFLKCQKAIDRAAQRGVIHKNQAARRKSRLSASLKAKKTAKA